MRIKYLFLLILFLTIRPTFSQSIFEITVGGAGEEICEKVLIDGLQFVLAGHTTSLGAGSYDICLVRTDTSGNVLGNTIVGSTGEDLPLSATQTPFHEYVLTGYTNSFGTEKPFAAKFDRNGNLIWSKYYSLDGWGEDIAALPDGSFYLTGYTYSGLTNVDVLLLKCDSSGNVIWSKTFGDSLLNEGRKVVVTENGGAILCGIDHVQAGGPSDIFVIKTDSSGKTDWSNRYATTDFWNWDLGYAVKVSGENILIGSLSYNQAFNPNPNSPDGLILILDKDGDVKNSFAIGEDDYDDIRDVSFISEDKFCITGTTNHQTYGATDFLFAIIDTAGNILNQQTFGGSTFETGLSVEPMNDGTFLLGGYSESLGNGQNDMYFIKTDGMASTGCHMMTGSVSSLHVDVSKFAVFDTASVQCAGLFATYFEIHTSLPTTTQCMGTGIQSIDETNIFIISPNPFYDFLNITILNADKYDIDLFDVSGRRIKKLFSGFFNEGVYELNASDLSDGVYFCKISSSTESRTWKIVKSSD